MNIEKWLKKSLIAGILRFAPLALLASLTDAAMLWGIRSFMDLLNHESAFTLMEWVVLMVLLSALRLVFLFCKTRSSDSFLYDTSANISNWFLHTLRSLSPTLFHKPDGDAMVEAAYESTQVLQNNGIVFFQAVQATLQLVIFFPVLFYISWPLTLFLCIMVVPLVAWIQRKLHAMGPVEEDLLYARSRYRSDLNKTRKLYRNWSCQPERSAITSQLRNDTRHLSDGSLKASIRKNALALTMETISVLSMIVVLAFCAELIHYGWMDSTGLVLFCSAILLCYKPVKECSRVLPQFRSALSAYKLLLKFGHLPRKQGIVQARGDEFSIKNASFSYSEYGSMVFSNFSIAFQENKPVLLRGKNGAGKSTLLRLMATLEEWSVGEMTHMAKARMRGIFFVAQDLELPPRYLLFKLLEADNSAEIKHFINFAGAAKLLKKEGLSGGERARVALTWALASKAAVILLDEPFAAVALAEREPILREFLEVSKKRGKWVVLASHDSLSPEMERNFCLLEL